MSNLNCPTKRKPNGFTLVELLVVIAIIMILAGVVTVVINPALMRKKSAEAVVKANTSKLCMALNGCGSLKDASAYCDTADELGVQPLATGYAIASTATAVTVSGTVDSCTYTCSFNFSDGTAVALAPSTGCEDYVESGSEIPVDPATCTDSDGGAVYSTKGTCDGANGTYVDSCSDRILTEYVCESEENTCVTAPVYKCIESCIDGACVSGT